MGLLASLSLAAPALADERIRFGNCNVYKTAVLDPIAKTSHVHAFAGGDVRSNSDTGFDIQARRFTSCQSDFSEPATSGRWYPCPKAFCADKDTLYYRGPGSSSIDQSLRPIPIDLRLLNSQVIFKGDLTTVNFPNCLAMNSSRTAPLLDSFNHRSHAEDKGANPCDSSHPYRIPRASYLIHWNGQLTSSTPVSMGNGEFGPAGTHFHADYLAANQPVFNDTLIRRCLIDGREGQDVKHATCGQGP
jgi:hypothetical protein